MKVIISQISRQGGRSENQDTVLKSVNKRGACLVVCDGLGAYSGSGKISRVCADKFAEAYNELCAQSSRSPFSASSARHCVQEAARGILNEKRKDSSLKKSTTTLAAVLTDGKRAVFCHAGDTRIYRIHNGIITYVTKDHSVARQLVDENKLPRSAIAGHPDQNKLTRTVSGDTEPAPDITVFTDITAADKFLICTDGFWTAVTEPEIEKIISSCPSPAAALRLFEQHIIKQANPRQDNYSAILCYLGAGDAPGGVLG